MLPEADDRERAGADCVELTWISYATPAYHDELRQLRESLEAHGVTNYKLVEVPSLGTWQANTQYKVQFIREMLSAVPEGAGVIWCDADARLIKQPELFQQWTLEQGEFAVHRRTDRLGRKLGGPDGEVLSGTILVLNTDNVHAVFGAWVTNNSLYPDRWEQKNLQLAIDVLKDDVQFGQLPADYCMIVARGAAAMGKPGQGVIEHHQASRRLRSKVHGAGK